MTVKDLRNENNIQSKKLNNDNQKIYINMVCYLRVSNLSEKDQEEICSDILCMFLDWQRDDKLIKDMIGDDYKQFVDNIIAAINPHKKLQQKILEYTLIFIKAICIMFTVDFISLYLPKIIKTGNLIFIYDYSLDMLIRQILILICAIWALYCTGKNSFRLSKIQIFSIISCIGIIIISPLLLPMLLGNITVASIDIRTIIVVITVFWLFHGVQWLLNHRSMKLKGVDR